MTRRQRRMLAVAGALCGVAVIALLLSQVFKQNLMYFYSATEVVSDQVPPDARFRLGGLVVPGSVERQTGELEVAFSMADCEHSVPVTYAGILPDLFREGQGIVATGKLQGGVFIADEVLAKHDENYMPPELAEKLDGGTGHQCTPFKSMNAS